MSNTLEEIDYKRNPEKYNLQLLKLQKENLELSNSQLKKYWLLTAVSFLLGVTSSVIPQYILNRSKEESSLTYRIKALEQTVSQMEDSIQSAKALHTTAKDSTKKK